MVSEQKIISPHNPINKAPHYFPEQNPGMQTGQ
jgi:hypothetical protein